MYIGVRVLISMSNICVHYMYTDIYYIIFMYYLMEVNRMYNRTYIHTYILVMGGD